MAALCAMSPLRGPYVAQDTCQTLHDKLCNSIEQMACVAVFDEEGDSGSRALRVCALQHQKALMQMEDFREAEQAFPCTSKSTEDLHLLSAAQAPCLPAYCVEEMLASEALAKCVCVCVCVRHGCVAVCRSILPIHAQPCRQGISA